MGGAISGQLDMELGVPDEMVQEYFEHHREKPNTEKGNWIFE